MAMIDDFRKLVQMEDAQVYDDIARLRRISGPWSPWTFHFPQSQPKVIIEPNSVDAMQNILASCDREGIDILVMGGATGTQHRNSSPIVMSTARLTAIAINHETMQLEAGAGATVDAVEAAAVEAGYTTGQWLSSGKSATVGGSYKTNAHGLLAGRYGRFTDAVTAVDSDNSGRVSALTMALHLPPAARAISVFRVASEGLSVLREVGRARLNPARMHLTEANVLTLIVEGEPLLESGRYQLIAGVINHFGGHLAAGIDTDALWDNALRTDLWAANKQGICWADRIFIDVDWNHLALFLDGVNTLRSAEAGTVELAFSLPTPSGFSAELFLECPPNHQDILSMYSTLNALAERCQESQRG